MILLVDADIIVYRVAASNQDTFVWDKDTITTTSDIQQAQNDIDRFVDELLRKTRCTGIIMALSSLEKNFRYSVLPTYKHNRQRTIRPVLREALNRYVTETYDFKRKKGVEGDDVLGIQATAFPDKYLIASVDKDLKQIPGTHYNWDTQRFCRITEEQGDHWFYTQVLTGDAGDGYKGCPGVGKAKADKILAGLPHHAEVWQAIVKAYEVKGLTEADAIQQARVARILRSVDYNFNSDEVVLWNPLGR